MMHEEYLPLDDADGSDEKESTSTTQFIPARERDDWREPPSNWSRWSTRTVIASHVALLAVYICVGLAIAHYYRPNSSSLGPKLTWTPASHLIDWEIRVVDGLRNDSIFSQKPSKEVDQAWHNLLDNINIRILPEEMARLGQTSLDFQDGTGSLGTIGVYHELHCIKRVRWWLYRDYYYPVMTEEEELEHYTHADHCLELMRQAAICRGDTTVTPFKWLHSGVGPHGVEPTTQEGVLHQCVKWDPIEQWARERRVDLFDPELLVWPET